MRKLCLLLPAVFLAISVFSQSGRGYVYLKNGSILKGKYQYVESGKLRVESAGNIWVFEPKEIDFLDARSSSLATRKDESFSQLRFFYRAELGVLAGNSQNGQSAPFSVTGSVNYAITSNFSAGAGFGAEFLKESYMPVFFNAEYKIRDDFSSPYLFVKAGYQISLEGSREIYYDITPAYNFYSSSIWPGPSYSYGTLNPKGGILINPGIGYSHLFSSDFGVSVAFGYQYHRLRYRGEEDYGLDIDYNRLTVKLGFIFN